MLLQDVKDLINNQDFDQARAKLISIIDSDHAEKIEAYKLLLFLSQDLHQDEFNQIETQFINHLDHKSEYEELYKVLNSKRNNEKTILTFEQNIFLLNCLWELGRVKEFAEAVKSINSRIIENKRYNHYLKFYETVTQKTNKYDFLLLSLIWIYIEQNHISKVIEKTNLYLDILFQKSNLSKKRIIHNLEACLDIFYKGSSRDYRIDFLQKKIIIELNQHKGLATDSQLFIEYILQSDSDNDLVILLNEKDKLEFRSELLSYLKRAIKLKKFQIPKRYKNALELFQQEGVLVQKRTTTHDEFQQQEDELIQSDIVIKPTQDSYLKPLKKKSYQLSPFEKDILKQLDLEDYSNEKIEELCVSFIELELYHCAEKTIDRLEPSTNKEYLKAEIALRMDNFSEVIYAVNDAIENYELKEEDQVPFLYQKFNAFRNLGKTEDAVRTAQYISRINPSFKQISEFLITTGK